MDSSESGFDADVDSVTSEFQNLRSPSVTSSSSSISRCTLPSGESGYSLLRSRGSVFNEHNYEREMRLRQQYVVYEKKKIIKEKKEKIVKMEWSTPSTNYKSYSYKKSKVTKIYNKIDDTPAVFPSSLSQRLENGQEIEISQGIQHITPQLSENNNNTNNNIPQPLVRTGQVKEKKSEENSHETIPMLRNINGNNSSHSNSSNISDSNTKILAPKRKPLGHLSSPSSQKKSKADLNITPDSLENDNNSDNNNNSSTIETAPSSSSASPTHSSYSQNSNSSEDHEYSSNCSCEDCNFSFIIIELDKDAVLKLLESSMKQMKGSEFLIAAAETLQTVVEKKGKDGLGKRITDLRHVVIYGLGSLSRRDEVEAGYEERHDSLHQFTFITCLLQKLGIPNTNIDFFDPIFTDIDKDIITNDFGFNVVDRNELGQRKVDNLTLFYLPHVTYSLTNGVLHANWSKKTLSNVIILGNSFQNVLESVENKLPHSLYGYIKKANTITKEVELNIPKENNDYPTNVEGWPFDRQAIHVFPPSLVQSKTDKSKFWAIDSTFEGIKPPDGIL